MNQLIEDFIKVKKIAIVGMSRSGKKFGNTVGKELKLKGLEIFPVHPELQEIDGMTCYPNLKSLAGKVDGVWISISPEKVNAVLEEAAEIGLKNIWLQQGSWSNEVQETIDRLKLQVVVKKCIMMYTQPVHSVHKFHRTIMGIFGKL
jgi:hypothetical protein